jgi:quinohemoprotein ethanol dehydrogenase
MSVADGIPPICDTVSLPGKLQTMAAAPGAGLMLKLVAQLVVCSLPTLGTCAAQDWSHHNADSDETAYSSLKQVDEASIGRLGLAWWFDLPGEAALEATPLAVDGVLYFTGSYGTVYAINGVTGKMLWKYSTETWKHNPQKMLYDFAVNRGVAYEHGRVFSAAPLGPGATL